MNLISRAVDLEHDKGLLKDFISGRQAWASLPPYWNTGKSRMAMYLTMFEGPPETHRLWLDEAGGIQGYTYLSPGEKTPIYFTPDERQWRIMLHPAMRSKALYGRLIADAETRLNERTSPEPLTAVAYDSDRSMIEILGEHGYEKGEALEVYMACDLSKPIAGPVVPEGFVVRPFAGLGERETRAIVPNSAFGGFDGPSEWALNDIGFMDEFCQAIRAIDFVATTVDGRICSSAVAFNDLVTKLGEFDPVATHQDFQRLGLAKALLLTALHWMRGAGMETAVIRTGVDNVAAIGAYESVGYRVVDKLFLYKKD